MKLENNLIYCSLKEYVDKDLKSNLMTLLGLSYPERYEFRYHGCEQGDISLYDYTLSYIFKSVDYRIIDKIEAYNNDQYFGKVIRLVILPTETQLINFLLLKESIKSDGDLIGKRIMGGNL